MLFVLYLKVENVLLPKKKYRQAVYECSPGYRISSRTGDSMFCQEFTWTGLEVRVYTRTGGSMFCQEFTWTGLEVRVYTRTGYSMFCQEFTWTGQERTLG